MSKVSLNLGVKNNRSCEGCTRCCEGWLTANIKGVEMSPGNPCQFVEVGVGCTIYDKRPKEPCKTFSCMWKADMSMPEEFKPSVANVLVSQQSVDGIAYLAATETGVRLDSEFLSWFVSHVVSRKINAEWHVGKKRFFIGDQAFAKAMTSRYEQDKIKYEQLNTAENSAE